jgi:hypothetical protein
MLYVFLVAKIGRKKQAALNTLPLKARKKNAARRRESRVKDVVVAT